MIPIELHYTGHPLIDIGIAAASAYAKRRTPQEVTADDLSALAGDLTRWYTEFSGVQRFLSVIFMNATFVQNSTLEKKQEYAQSVLHAFHQDRLAEEGEVRCTFFPERAALMTATRKHIPLLNGESTGNFSANGQPGLPMSGLAMLAIHTMPLGCLKTGHLLGFHQLPAPGQPDLNVILAKSAVDLNLASISLMTSEEGDMQSYGSYQRTRYIEKLLATRRDLVRKKEVRSDQQILKNVTGFYFTNYGPSPKIEILKLLNSVGAFIERADIDHPDSWNRLIAANWQPVKGEEEVPSANVEHRGRRNFVFEQLFDTATQPMRLGQRLITHGDWALVHLFLEEIINMQQKEIDNLYAVGTKLAHYMDLNDVSSKGLSWGFYHQLKIAKPGKLRALIRSANESLSRKNRAEFMVTVPELLLAFYRAEGYGDFYLARDIVAMVVFDTLHTLGHVMGKAVPEEDDDIATQYAAIPEESEV